MYSFAVKIFCDKLKYGSDLTKWQNNEYDEGENLSIKSSILGGDK